MSRKSSRVQGSWAPVQRKKFNLPSSAKSPQLESTSTSSNSKSSVWAGNRSTSVDVCHSTPAPAFQLVNPTELKQKPKDLLVKEVGEYSVSETVNGTSKLVFEPHFLEKFDADWMLDTLRNELPWKQRTHKLRGKTFMEPRLTAWFSEFSYTYSGTTQDANNHWHPLLTALRDRLNDKYKLNFNSLLANLYRDGHDSVDWHSDNEPALGRCPPIASLSFGDTRNFELRQITPQNEPNDFNYSQHVRVPLSHGSLLLMLGSTQHDWQHRVPKEYHDRGPRINLTFRSMHPNHVVPFS